MDGLSDVSGMKIVMIRYTLQVVIFQGGEIVQQSQRINLEGFEKISGLQNERKDFKASCFEQEAWNLLGRLYKWSQSEASHGINLTP